MHDDHQHTALQQAIQAVHHPPKILVPLPHNPINNFQESVQDTQCEDALSQNLVLHQGAQESKHLQTILMFGYGQNVTKAFFRTVKYMKAQCETVRWCRKLWRKLIHDTDLRVWDRRLTSFIIGNNANKPTQWCTITVVNEVPKHFFANHLCSWRIAFPPLKA